MSNSCKNSEESDLNTEERKETSLFERWLQEAKEANIFQNFITLKPEGDIYQNDSTKFTDFERFACIGLLNEMTDKLAIIGVGRPSINSPDSGDLANTDEIEKRTNKFQQDSSLLEFILNLIKVELYENSSVESLTQYLILEENKIKEEHVICSMYDQYSKSLQMLKDVAEKNDRLTKHVIQKQTALSNDIERELQESMFHYGIKLGYNRKLQEARLELNTLRMQMEEGVILAELDDLNLKMSQDGRVHRDIMLYLNMSITKLNKDITSWKKRYEIDIAAKDKQILEIKNKKVEGAEKIKTILNTYMKRRKIIQNYLEEKRIRIEAEELKKSQEKAATKIQAWWKGTMVRWKLGEYAEKKKKKKGKEKGRK